MVRSDRAAEQVTAAGATAVQGDLTDRAWLAEQLRGVDGAIHTASPGDATSPAFDRAVVAAAVEAFDGTSKPYVHTSGLWMYGSGEGLTEDSPLNPPALTAWRPSVEAEVLDSDLVASIVVPAVVYGHNARSAPPDRRRAAGRFRPAGPDRRRQPALGRRARGRPRRSSTCRSSRAAARWAASSV